MGSHTTTHVQNLQLGCEKEYLHVFKQFILFNQPYSYFFIEWHLSNKTRATQYQSPNPVPDSSPAIQCHLAKESVSLQGSVLYITAIAVCMLTKCESYWLTSFLYSAMKKITPLQ